jgi:hypothetical protein
MSPEEIEFVEKECANLDSIWNLKQEWDNEWEEIKLIKFLEFNNEDLDDKADEY